MFCNEPHLGPWSKYVADNTILLDENKLLKEIEKTKEDIIEKENTNENVVELEDCSDEEGEENSDIDFFIMGWKNAHQYI